MMNDPIWSAPGSGAARGETLDRVPVSHPFAESITM
jgi:hypothetical protein